MNKRLFPAILFLLFGVTLACGPVTTGKQTAVGPTIIVVTATQSPTESPTAPPGNAVVPTSTVAPPPTAPPPTAARLAPPTIISFTANKSTIVEHEDVTLSWEAQGGTEAYISWVGADELLTGASGTLNPNGGTTTISPDGNGEIVLTVRNSAGEATSHLQLTIKCAHEWVPALANHAPFGDRCPREAQIGPAAQQPFEHGFMIWMGASRTIYVFYNQTGSGQANLYSSYADEFHEGDPESDPSLTPPTGLYQPIRGFGLVWRTHPEVQQGLGWATAPETGFNSWEQGVTLAGMHNSVTLLQGIDGTIYQLRAFGSTWSVYKP